MTKNETLIKENILALDAKLLGEMTDLELKLIHPQIRKIILNKQGIIKILTAIKIPTDVDVDELNKIKLLDHRIIEIFRERGIKKQFPIAQHLQQRSQCRLK